MNFTNLSVNLFVHSFMCSLLLFMSVLIYLIRVKFFINYSFLLIFCTFLHWPELQEENSSTLTIKGVLRSDLNAPVHCSAANKLETEKSAPLSITVHCEYYTGVILVFHCGFTPMWFGLFRNNIIRLHDSKTCGHFTIYLLTTFHCLTHLP